MSNKKRARYRYNDQVSKGLGLIKCSACGHPLRDHDITVGPCPTLKRNTIYTPRPARHRVNPNKETM